MLDIHSSIHEKLDYFYQIHKIPNIIFHGPCGSGKKTILHQFIQKIYQEDKEKIKSFVMYVNCAHGKGIKFIREKLIFFAKTQIISQGGDIFKSIVLLNADKLTMEAQSALRRCIEKFNHNTRFFIIVENKYKLLKPILSRFCEIHVPEPVLPNKNGEVRTGNPIHLYTNQTFQPKEVKTHLLNNLKKELAKLSDLSDSLTLTPEVIIQTSVKLYERGYSGYDLITLLESPFFLKGKVGMEKRYECIITFHKIRREIRNEKLLMTIILHFLFLSLETCLENISFM
jgi:GTPase SAR1 family protein